MVPFSAVYVVPLGLALFGTPFIAIGVWSQRVNAALRAWPRVKGKIVTSAVRTITSDYFDPLDRNGVNSINAQGTMKTATSIVVDAHYTYEADGQTREGTQFNREGIGGSPKEVQTWVAQHPAGTEVTVYVDPHNPATAYLELRRWSLGGLILTIWGGVFIFIGFLVLVIFLLN